MALTQRDWVNDEAPAIDAIYLNELDDEVRRLDTAKVGLSGNETINGIKTFTSSPIVPTPTTGTQVANKDYVDNLVGQDASSGDVLVYADYVSATTGITTYEKMMGVIVPYAGTFKVSFWMDGIGSDGWARIYVNDVAVGLERNTNTAQTYVENITISAGDEISIYGKARNNYDLEVADLKLFASQAIDFAKSVYYDSPRN